MRSAEAELRDLWRGRYEGLLTRLPSYIAQAAPLLCGFSACTDVRIEAGPGHLQEIEEAGSDRDPSVRALSLAILARLREGRGGELDTDEAGIRWLASRFHGEAVLGGTSAHVARAYSSLGAPAALALRDRSAAQLDLVPEEVRVIAADGILRSPREIVPRGAAAPPVFVLEVTRGTAMTDGEVRRSTRIIVITRGRRLDTGDEVLRHAEGLGEYGLLASGFQTMDPDQWPIVRDRVIALARRATGFRHHEVAEYRSPEFFRTVVTGLAPWLPSLGMSLSELDILAPGGGSPVERAASLAAELKLERLCVHADGGAFALTRGDPDREREALLAGCLFASNRAAHGAAAVLGAAPAADAQFDPVPGISAAAAETAGYALVSVVSPYLSRPRTTLGLGDTFVAGTALILNPATSSRSTT